MPFIDWNGNGKIDYDDIAISIMLEDDDDEYEDDTKSNKSKQKPSTGCLTHLITFLSVVLTLIYLFP